VTAIDILTFGAWNRRSCAPVWWRASLKYENMEKLSENMEKAKRRFDLMSASDHERTLRALGKSPLTTVQSAEYRVQSAVCCCHTMTSPNAGTKGSLPRWFCRSVHLDR
jgi:hypothetical protein